MKTCFLIAFIFACIICEITSLQCYSCLSDEKNKEIKPNSEYESFKTMPNCASQELVECPDDYEFCFKLENDWFSSLFQKEPAGHYFAKGCGNDTIYTESGYYWFFFQWVTCCQGD